MLKLITWEVLLTMELELLTMELELVLPLLGKRQLKRFKRSLGNTTLYNNYRAATLFFSICLLIVVDINEQVW